MATKLAIKPLWSTLGGACFLVFYALLDNGGSGCAVALPGAFSQGKAPRFMVLKQGL